MFDKSNKTHPPATRFHAGQKLIFWAVVVGGVALSVSGILLLFPFSLADINGMQLAQYFHATAGMAMIAVILAHNSIGPPGMESPSQVTGRGMVGLPFAMVTPPIWVELHHARPEDGTLPETPHHKKP